MDIFLDKQNLADLYNFLNDRSSNKLSTSEFHAYLDSFQKNQIDHPPLRSNNAAENLNAMNDRFLSFVLQKTPRSKSRKLLASPSVTAYTDDSNNQITRPSAVNPYFQPQIQQPLKSIGYLSGGGMSSQKEPDSCRENGAQKDTGGNNHDTNMNLFSKQFQSISKIDDHLIHKPRDQDLYVICNSRDRDVTKFPFHDYFQIELSQVIKNVVQVHCKNVILPNLNFFESEPYLFLQIVELDQTFQGSNQAYSKMFAQIHPEVKNPTQKFVCCKTSKAKKNFYNNPVASISRLTLRLCSSNGTPFPIPTDVFQVVKIENALNQGTSLYRITMIDQPRNQNLIPCFYAWLKGACRTYDPIFITGVPEFRQQLFFLDFETLDPGGDIGTPIVLFASSLKITNLIFSDIDFGLFASEVGNCLCSFNKLSITAQLEIKILDVDTKNIHSTIVK